MKKRTAHNDPIDDAEDLQMIRDFKKGAFVPVRNQKKAKDIAQRAAKRYLVALDETDKSFPTS